MTAAQEYAQAKKSSNDSLMEFITEGVAKAFGNKDYDWHSQKELALEQQLNPNKDVYEGREFNRHADAFVTGVGQGVESLVHNIGNAVTDATNALGITDEELKPYDPGIAVDYSGTSAQFTQDLGKALGSDAPVVAASFIPGVGPAAAFALRGAREYGSNRGEGQSRVEAGLGAGISAGIEIIPWAGKATTVIGKVVSAAAGEGVEEALDYAATTISSNLINGRSLLSGVNIKEAGYRAAVGASSGAILGGGVSAATSISSHAKYGSQVKEAAKASHYADVAESISKAYPSDLTSDIATDARTKADQLTTDLKSNMKYAGLSSDPNIMLSSKISEQISTNFGKARLGSKALGIIPNMLQTPISSGANDYNAKSDYNIKRWQY